jgi:hypothetical protein
MNLAIDATAHRILRYQNSSLHEWEVGLDLTHREIIHSAEEILLQQKNAALHWQSYHYQSIVPMLVRVEEEMNRVQIEVNSLVLAEKELQHEMSQRNEAIDKRKEVEWNTRVMNNAKRRQQLMDALGVLIDSVQSLAQLAKESDGGGGGGGGRSVCTSEEEVDDPFTCLLARVMHRLDSIQRVQGALVEEIVSGGYRVEEKWKAGSLVIQDFIDEKISDVVEINRNADTSRVVINKGIQQLGDTLSVLEGESAMAGGLLDVEGGDDKMNLRDMAEAELRDNLMSYTQREVDKLWRVGEGEGEGEASSIETMLHDSFDMVWSSNAIQQEVNSSLGVIVEKYWDGIDGMIPNPSAIEVHEPGAEGEAGEGGEREREVDGEEHNKVQEVISNQMRIALIDQIGDWINERDREGGVGSDAIALSSALSEVEEEMSKEPIPPPESLRLPSGALSPSLLSSLDDILNTFPPADISCHLDERKSAELFRKSSLLLASIVSSHQADGLSLQEIVNLVRTQLENTTSLDMSQVTPNEVTPSRQYINYAAWPRGGHVVPPSASSSLYSLTALPFVQTSNAISNTLFTTGLEKRGANARVIVDHLDPKEPGDCYAFEGSVGNITLSLHSPVDVYQVAVYHLSASESPSASLGSSPGDFAVTGWVSRPVLRGSLLNKIWIPPNKGYDLGVFSYDPSPSAPPLQLFQVRRTDESGEIHPPFSAITFSILNNGGHPEFTCVYRLQVLGELSHTF